MLCHTARWEDILFSSLPFEKTPTRTGYPLVFVPLASLVHAIR